MKIGHVDLDRDVLVIAEIGNNHEGDLGLAEELIGLAARAGAQAVKFQTIVPERLVAPDQVQRLAQLRRFALDAAAHRRLAAVAAREGVMFLSTPFALEAVALLDPLVPAFKIASGDNDFVPLLETVAATGKPVILSTGMTDLVGAAAAAAPIERVWRARGIDPGLALLHCASVYPAAPADANLRAIAALAGLGRPVGYSDHTLGIDAALAAVALGARVIEKHFTRSKTQSEFRDHALSAEPAELRELVERARRVAACLGDGNKRPVAGEAATALAARRSICAARDLPAGHSLRFEDLDWLRPAGGLPPGAEARILGRTLNVALPAGARILPGSVA
jgi:N,N'-diacetyllegionaminate synthase